MRDVIPDELSPAHEAASDTDAARVRESIEGQVSCPFCGVVTDGSQTVCVKCTMENTPAARKATRQRIGPWYVLQNRNPAAPGMKFDTLLFFVSKGRVKPHSVVRGPTTHQLWRFAAHVRGLSREFGVCYSCGGSVERGGNVCPHCNRSQEPPSNPDTLLENEEPESRLPIYKEIAASEVEQHEQHTALLEDATSEALAEAQRLAKEQEEALAREQRQEIERQRQAAEAEKKAAAEARELARLEQDAVLRERDALARAKELLEKERSALSHEREASRRERDAAAVAAREAANTRQAAAKELAAARELAARQAEMAATPPSSAPTSPPPPAPEATPSGSVWDLGDSESASASFRPTQGRPREVSPPAASIPPGQKGRAREGFLSAKDLAAAFKLNLAVEEYDLAAKPAEAHRPAPTLPSDFPFEPMPSEQPAPRRRGGYGKYLLLLAVVGTGAAVALVPELRNEAIAYWNDLTNQAPKPRQKPARASSQPASQDLFDNAVPSAAELPGVASEISHPALPTTVPADVPAEKSGPSVAIVPPAPAFTPTTAPAIAPIAPPTAPVPSAFEPSPVVAPKPPPAPVAETPSVISTQPSNRPTVVAPAPPADAAAQAKALFQSAVDAEVRRDFSASVGFLEQIEKLPREVWPSTDIHLRLLQDRIQLKQQFDEDSKAQH